MGIYKKSQRHRNAIPDPEAPDTEASLSYGDSDAIFVAASEGDTGSVIVLIGFLELNRNV